MERMALFKNSQKHLACGKLLDGRSYFAVITWVMCDSQNGCCGVSFELDYRASLAQIADES